MKLILLLVIVGVVLWWIAQFLHRRRVCARYSLAYDSEAVGVAVGYWTGSLRKAHPDVEDTREQLFAGTLRRRLAAAYAATEAFPDIGVFYFAPHNYGACPLLWAALDAIGIVHPSNRDLAHHHFRGDGRMRITLESVILEESVMSFGAGTRTRWPLQEGAETAESAACAAT